MLTNIKALPLQLLNHFDTQQMRCIQKFLWVFSSKWLRICTNKTSEQIYHELLSLQQPANNMLLLLIWSSNCTGQVLRALHEWALFKGGELAHWDLVQCLHLWTVHTEVALLLTAFLSLERLYSCTSDVTHSSELSVLRGRSQYNIWQNLNDMNYSFWCVVWAQVNLIKGQIICLLLVNVLNTRELILWEPHNVWDLYWKSRLFSWCSHDEVLSLLSACVGQIELIFTAFFKMHNKRNMLSMFEEDSDDSVMIALSEESQTLHKEAHKKVGKRRGCCAFLRLFWAVPVYLLNTYLKWF